jgi:hypothetical protein
VLVQLHMMVFLGRSLSEVIGLSERIRVKRQDPLKCGCGYFLWLEESSRRQVELLELNQGGCCKPFLKQ